jgi:hypothetical protein
MRLRNRPTRYIPLILALKQLGDDPKFGVETVRFFGKFLGINK